MKVKFLQIKRVLSAALFVLLMVAGMTKAMAQQVNQIKLTDYNFHNLKTIEERVFLLHSIQENEFFSYALSEEEGKIDIYVSNDYTCHDSNANSDFDFFLENLYDEWVEYSNLDKTERGSLFVEWRYQLEDNVFLAINEDFNRQLRDVNASCDGALEFSSLEGVYQFPSSVNSGNLGSSTPPYFCSDFVRPTGSSTSCLSTTPNPAFYYMQIAEPGNLNIYMYSEPSHDIDFDCWGPFSDIETACSQLSCSNLVDCSYSANATENCYINNAQSGQYYILLITNYSNQSGMVYFQNIGTGGTGCSGQKTVTANVNSVDGGTVTGAGVFDCGSLCTLAATANNGYVFMDWTDENGNVVSTDAEYSFNVWGNRTFMANFVEDNACYLTFNLNDANGDGWSGNYLVLNFEDGSSQKLTVPYGLSASSYSLPIADGSHITLGWISGANTDQCSFLVSYSNGNGIYNGTDLNENLNYEFDVNCVEMPAMFYTISATANPITGGTISCYRHSLIYDFKDGSDYLQYCTDNYAGGVGTGGGAVYWGVRFPAADLTAYAGQSLNKVGIFTDTDGDNDWTYSGTYTVNVYLGGATAPSTLVSTVSEYVPGDFAWHDITLTTPVAIDATQDLWLCFYTADISYPMSGCEYVGNNNSDFLSLDGTTWDHSTDYGLYYTWMIRGLVEDGAYVPSQNNVYSFGYGETCTLRAFPNFGYAFENWKENGNVISTNAEFSFIVNSNRDLVANFTKVPLTITAVPNFENRGTVTGAGEYLIDDTCTLTATANAGFAFANWTKDGAIVSTDAEYTFIVVDSANFVANFVTDGNIVFADANVKNICVAHWDTNGDGELSYVEAAAVTDLGNYFQGNTEIMMFNELQYFIGLTSIGANAFQNCNNLMLMTLPNNITSIRNYAFYNCSGLIGGLTIPNSVITIGNYAFSGCSGFMGILTIGNSVTTIGNYAFNGCRNFTGSLNIPNSVTTIGDYAFNGCTAFWGTLTIGNSVTSIGSSAFYGCTGLVGDIVIPNSVTTIGSNAFYDCHSFGGTLTLGNSVTTIGSSAFYSCYGLTGSLVIPNSVTTIGNSAFYNCHGFTGALIIGNSVTSIGSSAFYNCYGFSGTLTIGNSVTTIGSSAFNNCDGFTGNLDIPNSVTTIGNSAFYDCNGFVGGSLTIPSSVTSIGGDAFYYCTGFSEVYYNVTNHADISEGYYNYPFRSCSGHLNIGNNVVRIAANMFRNANFTGILTIPSSVIAINDNAFNNCWHLTGTLVIPNSINTIGISAFQNCDGLSEIIMGNNVMVVGNQAFYSCSGLTKVILPQPVTVIGIEAFNYCTQLSEVNMQSMVAPSIGWDVFANNATGRVINIPCGATDNYAAGYWSEWTDALNEMCDGYEITVVVNPVVAGNATGASTYDYSQMCTLTATGNVGYPFLNWTKNGVVVSTEATYSFGVTESCTYVANFPETPVSYEITATVNMDEGGTVEGVGTYLYGATATLTATANEGYQFAYWTLNGVEVSTDASYEFTVTENAAYMAHFHYAHIHALASGWNWFSTNLDITLDDLKASLVGALGNTAITINSQSDGSTTYNGNVWRGSLNALDVTQMYMIMTTPGCEMTLEGMPINPIEHAVTIHNGNNWFAFPLGESMTLSNAFAGFAVNGDMVISQFGSATYNGQIWRGSLSTLEPGKGYMYISVVTSGDRTFTFPISTK